MLNYFIITLILRLLVFRHVIYSFINSTGLRPPRYHSATSPSDQCQPQDQIVFIKTHKTGSTTLQLILQVYGYYKNSSFLLNAKDNRTGHIRYMKVRVKTVVPPLSVKARDYKNYYNNFDISTIHIRYNRSYLDRMMKNGTKYVSILRDPVSHFESAFDFFGHYKDAKKSVESAITKWFRKPKKGGHTDNSQIVDLGLARTDLRNKSKVERHINLLSQEFDLILITEHFDESLLVLRKLKCWSFSDILYIKQNVRSNQSLPLSESTREKIRQWNVADLSLYHHFNKTLWKKIEKYGPDFSRDLMYFRQMQSRVYESCVGDTDTQNIRRFVKRRQYKVRSNATDYCTLMTNYDNNVFHRLWERQNEQRGQGEGYVPRAPL